MRWIALVGVLVALGSTSGAQASTVTLTADDHVRTWRSDHLGQRFVVTVQLFQRGRALHEAVHQDGCSVTYSNVRLLAVASTCHADNRLHLRYAGRGRFRVRFS